jgi:hypothetical protein
MTTSELKRLQFPVLCCGKPIKNLRGLNLHKALVRGRHHKPASIAGERETHALILPPEAQPQAAPRARTHEEELEHHVSYILGHVDTYIEIYCRGRGLLIPPIAGRLAERLRGTPRR